MKNLFPLTLALLATTLLSAQSVRITGIMDGTNEGFKPRAIELYVAGTVDLGDYRLERAANLNTFASDGAALPLNGRYTDAFVYVSNDAVDFAAAFGSDGDFAHLLIDGGFVSGNGNDAFRLVDNRDGAVVDQTGGPEGDGTNRYQDGYLYRADATGPDGGWTAENWAAEQQALDNLSPAEMGARVPFGSFRAAAAGPTVSLLALSDGSEDGASARFAIVADPPPSDPVAAANIVVTYSLGGSASPGADYATPVSNSVTLTQDSFLVDLPVIDDTLTEGREEIIVTLLGVSDSSYTITGSPISLAIIDNEATPVTRISRIQGAGATSPLVGEVVVVEAVVTADFQGGEGLGGFFVQEEDGDQDTDPATSEGLFVFDNGIRGDVAAGDLVRVRGVVAEFSGGTQLDASGEDGSLTVLSSGRSVTATPLDPGRGNGAEVLEPLEGMLVRLAETVTVTNVDNLARFGEFDVFAGSTRPAQFTECNAPDSAANVAYLRQIRSRILTVDDGRSGSNRYPIVVLTDNEIIDATDLTAGSTLGGLRAIVDERFTGYRLQGLSTQEARVGNFPTRRPAVGGNLTVASINLLNYFNGDGIGGGFPTPRGADDPEEFQRQEAKIVAALCELDADVVGLMEIENDGYGRNSALQSLVNAISANCGTNYAFVRAPNPGDDEIQVALIYNTATVEQAGAAASLDDPVVFAQQRVPLAQTFRVIGNNPDRGQLITVSANHLRSKGGRCGAGDDASDGSGSCNGTRTRGAAALVEWLATNPTGVATNNVVIIGDLNAYRNEDPIRTIEAAGYVNTIVDQATDGAFPCGGDANFVFRGLWGSLDYALASPALAQRVTGAVSWHVNSIIPPAFDYDTRFNDPALYAPDFYRFSDHDPLVVGFDLGRVTSVQNTAPAAPPRLLRTGPGAYRITNVTSGTRFLITDATGLPVARGRTTGNATPLDLTHLPAGAYFVVLDAADGRGVLKLVNH